MVLPFWFPAVLILRLQVRKRREPSGERCPPPDSDLSNGIEFGKNLANLSKQFAANVDYRFEFQKRRQLFIGSHNKTLSVVAMRVRNKDRSPRTIHSCNARGLPKARPEKGSSPGHGGIYSAKTNTAQNQVSVNRTASKAKEGNSCQYQYPSRPSQEATCRFR